MPTEAHRGYLCHQLIIMATDEAILAYPQISNIRRTKSQNLNVSCPILQLSVQYPLKPGVKSRMKM